MSGSVGRMSQVYGHLLNPTFYWVPLKSGMNPNDVERNTKKWNWMENGYIQCVS